MSPDRPTLEIIGKLLTLRSYIISSVDPNSRNEELINERIERILNPVSSKDRNIDK